MKIDFSYPETYGLYLYHKRPIGLDEHPEADLGLDGEIAWNGMEVECNGLTSSTELDTVEGVR